MVDSQGGGAGLETRESAERDLRTWRRGDGRLLCAGNVATGAGGGLLAARRRLHVDVFESVRILLELGIDFHDDVILVELGEDGGDLALAEGVVEGVVDIGGENAEAGSSVAVDGESGEETLIQLVAGDIANIGEGTELVDEARRPVGKLFGVNIFEAVLKLGAADAVFHGEILNGLHEKRDSVHLGKFRLQTANDIGSIGVALRKGL